MNNKSLFAWSGGKDSSMALYELRKAGGHDVMALLTTVTEDYDRISMHGVRRSLLEAQAASLGHSLVKVYITKNSSNEEYEARMREALLDYKGRGVSSVVFGDIFLEDLKKYREDNLAKVGLTGVFPLWKRDTAALAQEFIALGFKAVITCVDTERLDKSFAGRQYDESFLADLPSGVDPCGENGEFHSFVYDGPIFASPVSCATGERVMRHEKFCFCDLIQS